MTTLFFIAYLSSGDRIAASAAQSFALREPFRKFGIMTAQTARGTRCMRKVHHYHSKEDDYRRHAADTLDLAQRASSTSDKARLLMMAGRLA
jgi:hypothetical protein